VVTRASLLYFDTLLPSSGLCVLRNGFLFAGASAGESRLYQFAAMGDEAGDVCAHSDGPAVTLVPRPVDVRSLLLVFVHLLTSSFQGAKNVVLRERVGGLAPVGGALCADITTQGQGPPQLWLGAGLGASGSLCELRRGLPVAVLAAQQLPGVPECVWTLVPQKAAGEKAGVATLLVLAFANATLSLGVNAAGAVAELPEAESSILAGVPSLHVAAIGTQGDLLQVRKTDVLSSVTYFFPLR
jgi:splicing factor 3B subunit 3